jgi:adenylyltransferase/sulfurtransferase
MQAAEVLKLVLGAGDPLIGRLLLVDTLAMRFRELTVKKNPDCAVCGPRPTVTRLIDYESFCGEAPPAADGALVSSPPMFGRVPEISVEDLKEKRERGDRFVLVDVREAHEWPIADLPDSVKIPLGTLPQSLGKLSKDDEIVVYCRSGARSGNAVQFLQRSGYEKAKNLAGGINRWAERIDPTLPKY